MAGLSAPIIIPLWRGYGSDPCWCHSPDLSPSLTNDWDPARWRH